MKKLIYLFGVIMLVATFSTGCSLSSEEGVQTDTAEYVVVSTSSDSDVEDTFNFQDKESLMVSYTGQNAPFKDAVYTVGILSDNNSIVWASSEHDHVFIYVKEKLDKSTMTKYLRYLSEDPAMSLNEFLIEYSY